MKKVIYAALSFAPIFALAQNLGNLSSLVQQIRSLINSIFPILLAIAVLYFFWGLITFIRGAGDPKKTAEGKGIMIWGIIALFVMVSVFGILNWLTQATGLTSNNVPTIPQI